MPVAHNEAFDKGKAAKLFVIIDKHNLFFSVSFLRIIQKDNENAL